MSIGREDGADVALWFEEASYVRGDDLKTAGALEGPLVGTRAKAKSSIAGAALAFLGVVAALLFGARRLKRAASVERADALLVSEIEAAARR